MQKVRYFERGKELGAYMKRFPYFGRTLGLSQPSLYAYPNALELPNGELARKPSSFARLLALVPGYHNNVHESLS